MKTKITMTKFSAVSQSSAQIFESDPDTSGPHSANLKSKIQNQKFFGSSLAFTLIELLVVIAIIAVLAAMLIAGGGLVMRHATISRAQSEMNQLETAIESYHSKY